LARTTGKALAAIAFTIATSVHATADDSHESTSQAIAAAEHSLHYLVPEPALRPRRFADRQERALAWSFVALNAVDAYQAVHRPAGIHEANPFLTGLAGDDPGQAQVLAFKTATTWGALHLARRIPPGPRRKTALWVLNAVQLAVVVHNERVSTGIVF
jgi:hypothetical protein